MWVIYINGGQRGVARVLRRDKKTIQMPEFSPDPSRSWYSLPTPDLYAHGAK